MSLIGLNVVAGLAPRLKTNAWSPPTGRSRPTPTIVLEKLHYRKRRPLRPIRLKRIAHLPRSFAAGEALNVIAALIFDPKPYTLSGVSFWAKKQAPKSFNSFGALKVKKVLNLVKNL